MSLSEKHENIGQILSCVPSNHGYIIDGKKYYGKSNMYDDGINVKLLDENLHVHVWTRTRYFDRKLSEDDTEWSAFTDTSGNEIVYARDMRPCPAELTNNGLCQQRLDPEHRKLYYHFSTYIKGELVQQPNDGRVLCRYKEDGNWYCWEKNNLRHCSVFYHN